jgi:hypothetical protein
MNSGRFGWWGWALPWGVLLLGYGLAGWLDPQHWLGPDPISVSGVTPSPRPQMGSAKKRNNLKPPPPWPDERVIRQQLGWHHLTLQTWKLGPQRVGAQEVRLQLAWLGALRDGMAMLRHLALEHPQMAAETLVLQAQPSGDWHIEWRGRWLPLEVPTPLPDPASWAPASVPWPAHSVLDPVWLLQHQRQLWGSAGSTRGLLHLVRPEQMQLVAIVRQPTPQAWVRWQQHTLVLQMGDRLGDRGAVIRDIQPEGVRWVEAGRSHMLRPQGPHWTLQGGQP